jgi:hypothetical protein
VKYMSSSLVGDKKYNQYLFEYRFNDAHWGIEITATSPVEAKERLKALAWANYKGEVAMKLAVPGASLIERIMTRFRQYTAERRGQA